MNVLVVSEPGVDGVFRYVEMLCHFLWQHGIGVHLAYSDRRAGDRLRTLVGEVEARGGRTLNLRTANRPEPADARALRELWRLAREIRPDVIHSHSAKAGFLGRALGACGVRAVQCYHPHAYVGMRPHRGRFDAVYNLIEAALGRISHSIVVSADEAGFARHRLRIPADRLHLIPNGVDLDAFAPAGADEKRRLRLALGLPPDALILGCIGRSSEQKDPVTLYRAFAQAAAVRDIVLLHVGKGELDGVLDQIVSELGLRERVFRCVYTSAPADFYRTLDGFALTSRYEGFSLALLEAMAVNLPLIHSECPGNRDLLAYPLSHRWSAAPGDVDGFARGMIAWHDRLRTASPQPINHREVARRQFNLRDSYRAVLRLYRTLMRPTQSPHAAAPDELPEEARAS